MELEAFVMVMLSMYLSTLDQLGIVAHQITRVTSVCKQLWEICLFAMLQSRVRVLCSRKSNFSCKMYGRSEGYVWPKMCWNVRGCRFCGVAKNWITYGGNGNDGEVWCIITQMRAQIDMKKLLKTSKLLKVCWQANCIAYYDHAVLWWQGRVLLIFRTQG